MSINTFRPSGKNPGSTRRETSPVTHLWDFDYSYLCKYTTPAIKIKSGFYHGWKMGSGNDARRQRFSVLTRQKERGMVGSEHRGIIFQDQ
jgi:hypothetical protein